MKLTCSTVAYRDPDDEDPTGPSPPYQVPDRDTHTPTHRMGLIHSVLQHAYQGHLEKHHDLGPQLWLARKNFLDDHEYGLCQHLGTPLEPLGDNHVTIDLALWEYNRLAAGPRIAAARLI